MRALGALILLSLLLLSSAPYQASVGPEKGPLRTPDNDNDFANATPAQSGQSYDGELDSSNDPQDIYKLSGSAGQVLNVSVFLPGYPGIKVRLIAHDPKCAFVEESNLGREWESVSILVAISNAPYYFTVALAEGLTGNYVLSCSVENPTQINPLGYFEASLSRVSNNSADWYVFTMSGGTNSGLNNDLAQFTIYKDDNLTLDVILYGLWLELWSYTFNISLDHPSGGMIQAAATYSGSYFLKVWARSGSGRYNVTMGVLQSTPNDNDQDGEHATKINNTPISSWIDQALDHYDFYKLYLVEDDRLEVTMTLNSYVPGKYMLWLLHKVSGLYTPVANASNFLPGIGWTNTVRLVHTVTVNNRYYIVPIAEHGLDAQGRISGENANASYTLQVTSPPSTNHAPIVASHPGYISMAEDSTFSPFNLHNVFEEPDGDRIGFEVSGSEHINATLSLDGTVTLKPESDWSGNENIKLTARDEFNASTSIFVNVYVYPTDDRPVVAKRLENLTMWEDHTAEINLSGAFWDPDIPYGDRLRYTWSGNVSLPMSLDYETLIVTVGPVYNFFGTRQVTFRAFDQKNQVALQQMTITVLHTNHPPATKVDRVDIEMMEDGVYTALIAKDYFIDRDTTYAMDVLSYTGVGSENISCSILLDGRAEIRPHHDWNGVDSVFIVATDTGNLSATLQVAVTVLPVNDPPFVASFSPNSSEVTVNETEELRLVVVAGDVDTPLEELTYAWFVDGVKQNSTSPEFTFITDLRTSRKQPYNITVTISDGEFTTSHSWSVPVFNTNQRPRITIISPAEGSIYPEGGPLVLLRAEAIDPDIDPNDPEAPALVYTWKEGNATLGISRSLRYKFPPGWHTVEVHVWDGFEDTVASVRFFVDSIPTVNILSPGELHKCREGSAVRFSAEVFDRDGDTLTLEWREGTKVLSTSANFTKKFSPGVHYIDLNVTDGRNYVEKRLTLKVEAEPKKGLLPGATAPATAAALLTVLVCSLPLRKRRRV
ncbi:MAG: Ig-like domain-containing protein [Thermoplasmata archaeon]